MATTSDLDKLSNAAVLDALLRARRYRASITAQRGPRDYDRLLTGLQDECARRGIALPPEAPEPAARPCRLTPLADHLVVRPQHAATMTAGGLYKPEEATAKEKPMQGTVLAVGPGRSEPGIGTRPIACAVGAVILFGRYAGTEVDLDDEQLLILREDDVLGILAPVEA